MIMRRKYYYCQLYHPQLVDVLEANEISYRVTGGSLTPRLISFSIWDTSANTTEIIKEISEIVENEPIITVEYTALEIASAELVWITPKKQCIDISNIQEAYLSACKQTDFMGKIRIKHRQQRNLFTVAKEPSMGTQTSFWAETSGFAELFADYRVHEVVKRSVLTGIDFKNVVLKNGIYSDKLFQITSQNLLDRRCIDTGHGERIIRCEICGKEQFSINGTYQLHIDFSKIDKKSDMYVTERMFGEGISYPLYLISQRFYQLLKQAKLAGGITVSPVVDTSKMLNQIP